MIDISEITPTERLIIVSHFITYYGIKMAEFDLDYLNSQPILNKLAYEEEVREILERRGRLITQLNRFEMQFDIYTTYLKN